MGGRPIIKAHVKGEPYILPKSAYLTMNVYKVGWADKSTLMLHDVQVEAQNSDSARSKVKRKYGIAVSRLVVSLVMRKGDYRPDALRTIK